jgi:ketosteroid isomerase-like protein
MAGTQQGEAVGAASESTAMVLERHLRALGAGDPDALLADYAPDAVLCLPDQTVKGIEALRAFFAQIGPLFPVGQTQFEVLRQEVHGDRGYVAWRASSPALDPSGGADTFVIRNGKIVFQSFGGQLNVKGA